MHSEIQRTQRQFWSLYQQQRVYLASKPVGFVLELKEAAAVASLEEDFSVRAAAQINLAACEMVLVERKNT